MEQQAVNGNLININLFPSQAHILQTFLTEYIDTILDRLRAKADNLINYTK